jgi:hypothetical protein
MLERAYVVLACPRCAITFLIIHVLIDTPRAMSPYVQVRLVSPSTLLHHEYHHVLVLVLFIVVPNHQALFESPQLLVSTVPHHIPGPITQPFFDES